MKDSIFRVFCYYVDEHIFSQENMGSYVSLVVDQSFVDDFCKENHTTENALMLSVRNNLWSNLFDHYTIKGFVAIQLFAATKRANTDGLTVKNYRDRLSQIVGWEINDLQKWMATFQEDLWLSLYQWCDKNYFQITKCKSRTGTGRYVQFPVNQALRVFTEEDLLYIAKAFVDKSLYPGEDITQTDFWKSINKHELGKYLATRHASGVIENSILEEDYLSQIYNYYLRWDGKYKYHEKVNRTNPSLNNVFAYLTEDFSSLELRDENLCLLQSYEIASANYPEVSYHFPFKREGLLLFKKDEVYDNRWKEVRYIEADEDDYSEESGKYGLAVYFRSIIHSKLGQNLKRCEILLENRNVIIYKVTRRICTESFFTEKRAYELYGGLRIGRNVYLKGATPILRLHKPSMVWIDGKIVNEHAIDGCYSLNQLSIGCHFIKLPNTKKIMIDVIDAPVNILKCWLSFLMT